MSESCDGCHADATHFLCDECLGEDEQDKLRAEVERLTKALDVEREWTRALGADSRSQQAQLDRVCDVIGFKGRNDATDVAGLVKTNIERLREALVWLENEDRALTVRGRYTDEARDLFRAALAGSPVETRRALAERVRAACAEADDFNADAADGLRCAIRALDLDALLGPEK